MPGSDRVGGGAQQPVMMPGVLRSERVLGENTMYRDRWHLTGLRDMKDMQTPWQVTGRTRYIARLFRLCERVFMAAAIPVALLVVYELMHMGEVFAGASQGLLR